MPDARLAFWTRVLLCAIAAVLLFGMMMMLLPTETQRLFNVVAIGTPSYPASIPPVAQPYIVFVYRMLGAVMIGWMLALLAIVIGPFQRGEAWAWWAISLSLGGWFAIDTTASLLTCFPGNALLNLGFGLAFAVPLAASRSRFRHTQL
jgi:hypothetical protein